MLESLCTIHLKPIPSATEVFDKLVHQELRYGVSEGTLVDEKDQPKFLRPFYALDKGWMGLENTICLKIRFQCCVNPFKAQYIFRQFTSPAKMCTTSLAENPRPRQGTTTGLEYSFLNVAYRGQ